jgi:hypothetical protein
MRLLLGRGGAFSLGPVALQGGVALSPYIGTSPDRVIVTDIDNDGDQDLIMRSAGPAFWSFLWLNNGSGVFSFSRSFDTEIVVAVGDLNQDGRKDLLVSDGRLRARVQLPNGSFAIAQALTSGSYPYFNAFNTFNPLIDSVAIADFDGDNDMDIVAAERTNTGGCFPVGLRNDGALPFVPVGGPGGHSGMNGNRPTRMVVGDLDLDGYLDLVVSNPSSASESGAGIAYGSNTISMFDPNRSESLFVDVRALADVDGDGDLDAIGPSVVLNRTIEGPNAGSRSQWGQALQGTGGAFPLLGATGPVRVGSPLEIRLVGARGGADGLLAIGTMTASIGAVGGTLYVAPGIFTPFTCNGPGGAPSRGSWTMALGALPPSLAGQTVHFQAGVADPFAFLGVALTNALTLKVGL